MLNFNYSVNPILDAIGSLHIKLEHSNLNTDDLSGCQEEINILKSFFNSTDEQAVILGLLLHQQFYNELPSISDLLEHLSMPLSAAIYMNDLLADFVKKDWMKPIKDIRHLPLSSYTFNNNFLQCITSNSWLPMNEKPIENTFDLLEWFGKKIRDRKSQLLTYNRLVEKTFSKLNSHQSLDLSAHLIENKMNPDDCTYFIYMCWQHYKGEEFIDLDGIFNDLSPSLKNQYEFRSKMKSKKHPFFDHKLVEVNEMDILGPSEFYGLSSVAKKFLSNIENSKPNKFTSELLNVINTTEIQYKKLYYNEQEKKSLNNIERLILPDQFNSFCDRMAQKGMRKGLTILLYGKPGTGKTETVLQLAKNSGREVLLANASNLRSKWIGQTEKNIRDLFTDYRKAIKLYDKIPILLFNEADSIMSTRRSIIDKVDQMENTMQNILLQELENFDGIFIATTNLEENLDKAFDRRLLYKVNFDLPDQNIRYALWNNKLPEMSDIIYKEISSTYQISGGQIDNICKKIEIEMLLEPELKITKSYIQNLINQELLLEKNSKYNRNPIGYLN